MTDRAKLAAELDDVRRTTRIVGLIVWAVAIAVMVYGIPIVYTLLVDHDIPRGIAWLLSPIVDGALAVGLVATGVLARYNLPYGWVGAIRWVAGFTTWALATAGPWTHPGGIDWLGVGTHSAGPIILFFTVEAAAQFQHKMGKVIAAKEAAVKALDDKAKSEQAQIAELTDRVKRLTADLKAADVREAEYTERAATLTANLDELRMELDTVRTALNEANERADVELKAAVDALKVKHNEQMARVRAEASTVSLNNYRSSRSRKAADAPKVGGPGRPRLDDEEALQKLLAEHPEPDFPWSQAKVRKVLGGGGWDMAARLVEAINQHHRKVSGLSGGRGAEGRNVEPHGDLSDDDKEDSRGLAAALTG
ncbi:hypothetical protein [Plantactinospora sp. WMMB782]|uniref:hypothetical protein n=1 Tax=Plantactinospora sp. WMMB782 TaxID=3404121 RepID=UPI003B956C70